jgi:hypothetical protein
MTTLAFATKAALIRVYQGYNILTRNLPFLAIIIYIPIGNLPQYPKLH